MSLKAKIEAVIYASEEPVTLNQLVGLLGEEAQAELDRADSAQTSLSLNETEADLEAAADLDPTLAPEAPAPPAPPAPDPESLGEPEPQAAAESEPAPEPEAAAEAEPQPAEPAASAPDQLPADPQPDAAATAKAERARLSRLRTHFRALLDQLIADYTTSDRGLEIREVAGGFRFATKPEYHDAVRGFVRSLKPPLKLSLQALETLAVVAYKQPVTAPEISEIRGVDSGGVLGSLMARKLVTTAGRKQVIGRPILYKTTKDFLLKFGLKDLNELPSIEEFERMAGAMAEQEEIPMPDAADPRPDVDPALEQSAEKLEPERDTHSAQPDGVPAAEASDAAPYSEGHPSPAGNLAPEDKASVDGRLSSLPPDYSADDQDDPSAQEAAVQSGENRS